jgi:hypothetical protein
MHPLTVLIGIVMGSAVAIALGLGMVLIIFLILAGEHAELEAEFIPLLRAAGLFALLSASAAASFVGELRAKRWRYFAHVALIGMLTAATWTYWPRAE